VEIATSSVHGRIQDLPQGEVDHGERVEREPITGVWGRAPGGGQGQSPLKLKAFRLFSYKKGQNFSI